MKQRLLLVAALLAIALTAHAAVNFMNTSDVPVQTARTYGGKADYKIRSVAREEYPSKAVAHVHEYVDDVPESETLFGWHRYHHHYGDGPYWRRGYWGRPYYGHRYYGYYRPYWRRHYYY